MTSEAVEAVDEANEATEETIKGHIDREEDIPQYIHTIDGEIQRHRCPQVARSRAVVERVIGAMKDFLILSNVPWISRQNFAFIFQLVVVIGAICNYNLDVRGTSW